MTDYLTLLRQSPNINAPDPNCIKCVKPHAHPFTHFVQSTPSVNNTTDTPQPTPAPAPPEVDMEPGWREREAIETWHRDWKPVWLRWRAYLVEHPGWQPPSEIAVRRQVTELVATWNACTGQHRAPDEVLRHLAPEDYRDRELMQPGALGLYVWTCLGEPLP